MSANASSERAAMTRYLLVTELRILVKIWFFYVIVVALIGVAIATLGTGTIPSSVWEKAVQAPRWFAAIWGVYQTAVYLPLFIAHGHTRHEFAGQVIRVAPVYGVALATLITVGFALEWPVYGLLGWPHVLDETHLLFERPTQLPLILVHYALVSCGWIAVGAAVGAAFYRYRQRALLAVPVALAALVLIESTLGSGSALRWLLASIGIPPPGRLPQADAELTLAIPAAIAAYAPVVAAGLWATWLLIRDLPMRTKHN